LAIGATPLLATAPKTAAASAQRGGVHQGYGNKECPKRAPDAQRISENSRWMRMMMMMMDAD
jgi:hypothetical protein